VRNEWTKTAEPTLAGIQREFPGWGVWRGISGRCYARKPGSQAQHEADAEGEDLMDLRDSIIRLIWAEASSSP